MSGRRLIIVSNRLPVHLKKTDGKWEAAPASGGLVSALEGIKTELDFEWIGWPGANVPEEEREAVAGLLGASLGYRPVFLDETQIDHFYNGFCNSVLWPLFHYQPNTVDFSLPYWDEYKKVNERFCDAVVSASGGEGTVWIHDYHLFLLPKMLRERCPNLRIGFFLHIPFPSSEIYRLLPVRREILLGLLGSDLIGFHTHDYGRYFASSCLRVLGLESTPTEIAHGSRRVAFGSYPIGVNPQKFLSELRSPGMVPKRETLQKRYEGQKVILGVDRVDYIKGLTHKLLGYERFLEEHPELRSETVLIQVAVPSRTQVREYQQLKKDVDGLVGRINGRFGTAEHTPIHYVAKDVLFEDLCALYERADVLLVTSLRDGMNLVSLEYTICQRDRHGVQILSEFAGIAHSLGSALQVNPWDTQNIADAIHGALTMDGKERAERALNNYNYARRFHSLGWAQKFLKDLSAGGAPLPDTASDLRDEFLDLKKGWQRSTQRLIFLDYDGTLVAFSDRPSEARPSEAVLQILKTLAEDPNNDVYLVSGRSAADLQNWFGSVYIGLAAEHGMFVKEPLSTEWVQKRVVSTDWMASVESVLKDHVQRTPGSLLEKKKTCLAWHYRAAEKNFAEWQALELTIHLEETLSNLPVNVIQGSKVLEVRPQEIDKGLFVREIIAKERGNYPFILCMGDDRTDEDMFGALPPSAWSCKVGDSENTQARFYLRTTDEALEILQELARSG